MSKIKVGLVYGGKSGEHDALLGHSVLSEPHGGMAAGRQVGAPGRISAMAASIPRRIVLKSRCTSGGGSVSPSSSTYHMR